MFCNIHQCQCQMKSQISKPKIVAYETPLDKVSIIISIEHLNIGRWLRKHCGCHDKTVAERLNNKLTPTYTSLS